MKSIRFFVFALCIICLVAFVSGDSGKRGLEKDCDELKCTAQSMCKIMSILGKVHEYQNTFLLYRKMYLAVPEGNEVLRGSALGKVEGFLYKLDRGNDFTINGKKFFTDDEKTIEKNKLMYEFVQDLLDPDVNKVWFEITGIKLKHIVPDGDSEYAIDCLAFVNMELHIEKDQNHTYNMELTVGHMKICEPD